MSGDRAPKPDLFQVVQIAVAGREQATDTLFALGNDGTLWKMLLTHDPAKWDWILIPPPMQVTPQPSHSGSDT